MLPMMERRWPLKIRPTSVAICDWSAWKRRAAAAMLPWSSPTLNAMTARTPQRQALLGEAVLDDLGLLHGQGEEGGLAEDGQHEGAVPDDDAERQTRRPGTLLPPPLMSSASLGAGTR